MISLTFHNFIFSTDYRIINITYQLYIEMNISNDIEIIMTRMLQIK